MTNIKCNKDKSGELGRLYFRSTEEFVGRLKLVSIKKPVNWWIQLSDLRQNKRTEIEAEDS